MIDRDRDYTYNHNILLSDKWGSLVVENHVLGERSIRHADAQLNPGVEWPYLDTIAVVNSFILEGKPDLHTTNIKNSNRWNSFLTQTEKLRWPVRLKDVQGIMSYQDGDVTEHIYRGMDYMQEYNGSGTLQQVLFDSRKKHLRIHFSPVTGPDPEPVFENVPLKFDCGRK